jgi:alpha-amylase
MSVTVPAINDMLIVKGPLVSILTNAGSGSGNHTFALESSVSGWAANTQVLDVVQCESLTTDGSGNLNVVLNDGMPRVMLAQADAGNVCDGYVKPSTSGSGSGSGSGGNSGNGAAGLRSVGSYGVVGLSAVAGLLALL